ncbi:MAG: PTS sugar transporter subunit IIA, partial [Spirochaetota bacterium]
MELAEAFDPTSCAVELSARDKEQALRKLAELAVSSKALEGVNSETIYNALADRERQGSTGFGKEVAIPHARLSDMDT